MTEKAKDTCCLIGCEQPADYVLTEGAGPSDYTTSCRQHVGQLASDKTRDVAPIGETTFGSASKRPDGEERLMQFFEYRHLPQRLQDVSRPCGELAAQMVVTLPAGPERTVGLRKLLEAKDCFVRAHLEKQAP